MPTYEPQVWNANAQKIWENNCYNYATNIQKNWHPPLLAGAEPGAASGKSICWKTQVANGPAGVAAELCDHKCAREQGDPAATGPSTVMEALKSDGLKDPVNGECAQGCWLVGVYVRRLNAAQQLLADYHLIRQDTLPNGAKKWSHKPGDGPVTDQKFVEGATPGTGTYNGGPITNPATDDVGIGPYVFCGYLCCCPDQVRIASYVPKEREEYAIVQYGGTTGSSNHQLIDVPADQLLSTVSSVQRQTQSQWLDGIAEGKQLFYLGIASGGSRAGIVIMERAVTVWDPSPRHFRDPEGLAASQFKELLGWWSPYSTQ